MELKETFDLDDSPKRRKNSREGRRRGAPSDGGDEAHLSEMEITSVEVSGTQASSVKEVPHDDEEALGNRVDVAASDHPETVGHLATVPDEKIPKKGIGGVREAQAPPVAHAVSTERNDTSGVIQKETREPESFQEDPKILQKMCDEYRDRLIRVQAEFENYRKYMERAFEESARTANERLITSLLDVIDNLERAIDTAKKDDPLYEGIVMVHRQLMDALEREGVSRIPDIGTRFDPYLHEAVERVETDDCEDNTVIKVYQKGYTYNSKVIRPARIAVAIRPKDER